MDGFTKVGLLVVSLIYFSCGNSPTEKRETPTEGSIKIGVEDAYKLLLDTEIYTFESLYVKAKVKAIAGAEGDLIELLKKDSVRFVVIGRELTQAEKDYFKAQKIFPKSTKIGYDGLTFVVNREAPDSNFSYSQLQQLVTGNIQTWSQLQSKIGKDSMQVVFDNPRSGNVRFLMESLGINKLASSCYAVKSNEEVINYVKKNKYAIGIVGSNWISDPQDTVSEHVLKSVKIAGISSKNDPTAALGYTRPYQGYIADGSYPFKRPIYIVSRELGTRLGTGFASFVAGEKGQRIVLRSGLVPAYGVVRLVNVNSE
jgi:phosphate transport system substrate-binding protein